MSILEELIEELKLHDLRKIAKETGVSIYTLKHWISGENTPLLSTAEIVANAMGLALKLV